MAMLRILAIALLASAQANVVEQKKVDIKEHVQGTHTIRHLIAADPDVPKHGLPEQGYHGEKVQHANMETMTKDWTNEYGPDMYGKKNKDGFLPKDPKFGFPGAAGRSAGATAWIVGAMGAVALARA
mmetsp:Transcript_66989/g.196586  ORF Transcript_66989/g.196586 Transcript_66989/m.196586 type:complete len:127 (+) Transcript_66989:88-468(+)